MFDLRAAVVTQLQLLDETYVGQAIFDNDPHSTAGCIEQMEKCVFEEAAILLGDLRQPQERFSYGFNTVASELELLVCAKSINAKANFNNIINNIKLGLDNNKFNQTLCWSTKVTLSEKQEKYQDKDRVYYQIITLEVGAWEASPQLTNFETNFNPPTITITSPTAGQSFVIDDPISIEITVTYTIGTSPISKIYYIVKSSSGLYSIADVHTTFPAGHDTFEIDDLDSAIVNGGGSYTVYVIIVDTGGASAVDTKAITISVA